MPVSDLNPAVGIDLGTTNTVIAVQVDTTGPILLEIPQPVNERSYLESKAQIKSAVFFESNNSAVVGAFANNREKFSFKSVKSHMGTRWKAKHPETGKLLSPAFINAHILALARKTIKNQFPKWDGVALITVPASFNTDQRKDTLDAAKLAGLHEINLLDEPTAAFYYFFNQQRGSDIFKDPLYTLIFDFGGGTLDVSVIRAEENKKEILLDNIGRSRYNNLGGDDIDIELATFFLGCWEYEGGESVTEMPLDVRKNMYSLFLEKASAFKEECEDYLKNDLDTPEFFVKEEIFTGDSSIKIDFKCQLSQSQYETITGKFFQSKSDLNIYKPIEEAILVAQKIDPRFSKDKLNLILYTGGSSNMLGLQRNLEAYFSGKTCLPIDEQNACNTVALGAASCRFDSIHKGGKKVKMTNRLLEAIFTRFPGNTEFITIVPLEAEPSSEFKQISHKIILQQPTILFKFPLFRGVNRHDHQLVPMRDLEFPLNKVMKKGTSCEFFYRMTDDKTIILKMTFQDSHNTTEIQADFHLQDGAGASSYEQCLYKINTI